MKTIALDLIPTEKPNYQIKKIDGEYFIKELDETSTGPFEFEVGTKVRFDKYIHRVGYEVHLKSFSMEDWEQEYARYLTVRLDNVSETDVLKVIREMDFWSPTSLIKDSFVRREIFNRLSSNESFKNNWRRMWFQNCYPTFTFTGPSPDSWQWEGTITERIRRWTGKYYAANIIKPSYYDPYGEYEPAGLNPANNQNLYKVYSDFQGEVMVHPLDIEVIE